MQLKALLVTLLPVLLGGGVSAFIVPTDIGDGAYSVTFDDAGTANITNLGEIDSGSGSGSDSTDNTDVVVGPADLPISAKIRKRDSSGGGGGNLFPNHDEYNWCTNTMKNSLDSGKSVPGKSIYFVMRGSVFLALCNYKGSSQGGASWEVTNFNSLIDGAYGKWRRGWWHRSGPNKTFWRDFQGAAICTNL